MSKINAVRLINLNYNNNSIKISDETFDLKGESTLLSLRNGGGKSVLVQMMMAPFVHGRYRNAKDRPFESYFTTNKPTFILVEWTLDQGAGYVLNGMMVRKNQDMTEENAPQLEMINFIAEYKQRCPLDIYHLPVVEKGKKEITLKNFGVCKQMFETWKKERSIPFFYYDMNQSAQSKQYFDKLIEYQINYKEWETIIKKVNLKESGLSDLFADCRDEKGLVEKWFLEAVENKLNKDKNRMQEFQSILEKYAASYKDNQSKIKRRDAIREFETDAEQIREKAQEYQAVTEEKQADENRIADFIHQLNGLLQEQELRVQELYTEQENCESEKARLIYEQLSAEFYDLQKEERFHGSNLDMIQMECDDLDGDREKLMGTLYRMLCAKQQEEVDESRDEFGKEQQRLLLCREKMEDLEPERRLLGAQLWNYYSQAVKDKTAEKDACEAQLAAWESETTAEKQKLEEERRKEKELVGKMGALSERMRQYDARESRFNGEYRENYARNILGEYEPGFLAQQEESYDKQLQQAQKQQKENKSRLETLHEREKSTQRLLEDKQREGSQLENQVLETDKQLLEFETELAERRRILPYFDLPETEVFATETILAASERKLKETERLRRNLEKEADTLEKEYKKMAQGQVLELSEEFKELLTEVGISYAYGMEWLQKNRFSEEKNRKLVRRHPFLPYALILTERDLQILKNAVHQVYTSFPVPIICREELEEAETANEGVLQSFPKLNFYVWFNENLLNEEKLNLLLKKKEEQLSQLKKNIDRKNAEYREYFEKQQKLVNQKLTKNAYEQAKELKEALNSQQKELETAVLKVREELQQIAEETALTQEQIGKQESALWQMEHRKEAFERLQKAYQSYLEDKVQAEQYQKAQERLKNQFQLIEDKLEALREKITSGQNAKGLLALEQNQLEQKLQLFASYDGEEMNNAKAVEDEAFSLEDAKKAESRYDIITSGITAEQQELEERVAKARVRLQKLEKELAHLQKKYGLEDGAWAQVRYDRNEEAHLESMVEDKRLKIEEKQRQIQEEKITLALLKQRREDKIAEMKKQCGQENPLDKEEIQIIDFEEAIRALSRRQTEIMKKKIAVEKKIRVYEENLTALAEYEHFTADAEVEWEQELATLDQEGLKRLKGVMVRDYNEHLRLLNKKQNELASVLNRIIRKEVFEEDFYRKPLEAMLELTESAELILKQLETTLASYHNLMEKLLVDISFVEKEKAKIVELLVDYIKEVHENLGKIDHNSTITIREKPVKMLKIELPDWEEKESIFQLRLQDYIDDVTLKSVAILEENKNAQEFIGTRVTTKSLYDAVVGISNVQIRLYKIEAQREYAITWADVAKNSGGEGFLSAFVILSSLLYYMRRDDSDIFADRNEGKVLVMDNPFAQTNAAHLLKPLMDMAKKTNTQLICLSGLGGESIYNRFDNIYVLNLIAANLRNGMQYLKADHMRGSDEETMIASQIEVIEQQELVF